MCQHLSCMTGSIDHITHYFVLNICALRWCFTEALSILAYSDDAQHVMTYSCSRRVERISLCSFHHLNVDVYSKTAHAPPEVLNYFGYLAYSKLCLPRVELVPTPLIGQLTSLLHVHVPLSYVNTVLTW